ncbi:MAG: type II toxin-antitoxin system VapC family toxin [Terracoccus sp.]
MNLGDDGLSYALARTTDEPLSYAGSDFAQTDIQTDIRAAS